MKKLLLAALFAPLISLAASLHEDGSTTLTKEEKEAAEAAFSQLFQDRMRLMMEQGGALEALRDLQKKHDALEKAKCA